MFCVKKAIAKLKAVSIMQSQAIGRHNFHIKSHLSQLAPIKMPNFSPNAWRKASIMSGECAEGALRSGGQIAELRRPSPEHS